MMDLSQHSMLILVAVVAVTALALSIAAYVKDSDPGALSVETGDIQDGAVTPAKLADNAVTPAKLDETGDFAMADLTLTGYLDTTGYKISTSEVTTGTIAVTHSTNYDVSMVQPAGTTLKDLIAIPAGDIATAGTSGDNLNISIGTSAGVADLLTATALLNDGGAAVTWTSNVPLYIIEDSHGHAANQFAYGGPATTAAIDPNATYSATERSVFIRLTPVQADLATAATTVTFKAVWLYH